MQKFFTCAVAGVVCLLALGCRQVSANGWEHTSIDFDVLVTSLDNANAELRRLAAESLGFRLQPGATQALLARLAKNESAAGVRQQIFASLGRLGDPSALSAIRDCLADEPDIPVRAECAGALGHIDSAEAERLALAGARDGQLPVRLRAIASLGSFSGADTVQTLKALIANASRPIINTAMISLGRTGSAEAVPVLIESLTRSRERQHTLVCLRALTLLAEPATAETIRQLYAKNSDENIRRHALIAMASTRARGSESYFIDALSSEDPATRILGLAVLRRHGGQGETPAIVKLAFDDSNNLFELDIERLLSDPLQSIGDLQLLNEYLKTVIHLNPAAGETLYLHAARQVSIPRSSATLLKIAQGFYQARWQALYGLGYVEESAAAEKYLDEALNDADARIRAVAARSLGVMGNPASAARVEALLADEAAEVRWVAARVLGRLKFASATPGLLRTLDDSHAQVRIESALALGYLDAMSALRKLTEMMLNDPDKRARETAAYAVSLIE